MEVLGNIRMRNYGFELAQNQVKMSALFVC